RQIFFRAVVDDTNLFTLADHLGELVERDIRALRRVVELAVRIALDDTRLDGNLGRRLRVARVVDRVVCVLLAHYMDLIPLPKQGTDLGRLLRPPAGAMSMAHSPAAVE